MNKCLYTKLNGQHYNGSLLAFGEMRISFSKEENYTDIKNHGIRLAFLENTTVSVHGGHFVHANGDGDLGTTRKCIAYAEEYIFVSNDDCYISLNKYILKSISPILGESSAKFSFNIDDLKYSTKLECVYSGGGSATGDLSSLSGLNNLNFIMLRDGITGDLSSLSGLNNLTYLQFSNTKITGDLSSLSGLNNLTHLSLSGDGVSGDISSLSHLTDLTHLSLNMTKVTGGLSNLSGLIKLNNLNLSSTKVTGNFSDLSELQNLTYLNLSGTNVVGDISVFYNMENLYELRLNISSSEIVGELSALPLNLLFYSGNRMNKLTWNGTRDSSYSIFGMEYFTLNEGDNALINLARCTKKLNSGRPYWYSIINFVGVRTSASDEAVSILQEKGYTVRITAP